jgi:adenylyltransferase/sulfurtransferase
VGGLRLIDRDVLELHNLQRQSLFTEVDVEERLPKAEAARRHLSSINSEVALEAHISDLDSRSIDGLLGGVDAIADGTDNYEARYLINDFAVREGLPWTYGGVLGSEGMSAALIPGDGPCLRCVFPEPPAAGSVETCETAGVWSPTVHVVAALEASFLLQTLLGEEVAVGLYHIDPRTGRLVRLEMGERVADCPACGRHRFEFLEAAATGLTIRPCGGGSVHITPPSAASTGLDTAAFAERVAPLVGDVRQNGYLVQFRAEECELTVFADGRALVKGTEDPARARSLYARFVGT